MMLEARSVLRRLAKSPGFTLTAGLVLALGIAGNTVVFSLVDGFFLKPLPFPHPEQLVDIDETAPKWNLRYAGINYADFEAWRAQNRTFAAMAHFRGGEFTLAANQRLERVVGQQVTHDLAAVFGIQPERGRMFRADEEFRGGPLVVVIGHHIWQEWFDGDPAIVGRTVVIDGESCEVIGVLTRNAVVPSRAAFWLPFAEKPKHWAGSAVGRLQPGVSVAQAGADLLRIHRARLPEAKENAITSPVVQPLRQRYFGDVAGVAVVLQGAVTVLLLIAAVNVAGLMLARTLGRVPELGVRAALGASRLQLTRHLLAEGLVLSLLGAAAGAWLGTWGLAGVLRLFPDLPAWLDVGVDWRLLLLLAAMIGCCATFAGLIPARHVLQRLDIRSVVQSGTSQTGASRERLLALRALVIAEIALACVLLVLAGLFGRALWRVQQLEPGLRADHLLTYGITLPEGSYRDTAARIAFFEQHLERLRALPGVVSASASTVLPFSGQHIGNFFEPEGGLPGDPAAASPVVLTRMSFPGYFETMGISLRAGRDFGPQDWRQKIIVNETLARLFWPGENAVGKRLRSRGSTDPWLEVIAVARDVRHYGLEAEVRPGVYVPFPAMPQSSVGMVLRTRDDPNALGPVVRALLQQQDPTLPVAGMATMEERINRSLFFRRFYSAMTALFAGVAGAIALSGVYGIVAYVVRQRMREFGVRIALGARAGDVRRLVVREGLQLAVPGVALGLVGGVAVGLALGGLLLQVSPLDPIVIAGTTVLLGLTVLAACLVPAHQAMRVDPGSALRAE